MLFRVVATRPVMREATESGLAHTSTSIFHFPVETGNSDTRSGGRDGRRTCRSAVVGATDLRTSGAICHRSSHGRGRLQQARRMVVAKALL